jgi:hypothetical protein
MIKSPLRTLAGMIFFCLLFGCSQNPSHQEEIESFLDSQKLKGVILKKYVDFSSKDPEIYFSLKKINSSSSFAENKQLNFADSHDLEYYSKEFKKKFTNSSISDDYYLLRGESIFGNGMCMRNPCNIYVLESREKKIVYVAIFNK